MMIVLSEQVRENEVRLVVWIVKVMILYILIYNMVRATIRVTTCCSILFCSVVVATIVVLARFVSVRQCNVL